MIIMIQIIIIELTMIREMSLSKTIFIFNSKTFMFFKTLTTFVWQASPEKKWV